MRIQHHQEETKGFFTAYLDTDVAGQITYSKAGKDLLIFDHTEVSDEYRGKGVGQQILAYAMDYVRENGLQIIPLCSFVKAEVSKTPKYQELIK